MFNGFGFNDDNLRQEEKMHLAFGKDINPTYAYTLCV